MDKSLQLKLLLSQLPEFEYAFGDPRPVLLEYMLSFQCVETYLSNPSKLKQKEAFAHKCKPHDKKPDVLMRGLVNPDEESMKVLDQKLAQGTSPFVALPMMCITTTPCKPGEMNQAKHLMVALYNRNTNELERIDIKKYHIRGFKIKLAYKIMKSKLVSVIEKHHPNCQFVLEHDVTSQALKKLGTSSSKHAFPIYLIAYLNERFANPTESTLKIQRRVNKLSLTGFLKYWNHYVEFRKKNTSNKCDIDHFLNMQTNRCVKKTPANLAKHAMEQPPKPCKNDTIHDPLQNRCVKKDKLASINIAMDKVIAMDVKRDDKLKSLGRHETILPSVMYVMSRHPDATLINPAREASKKDEFSVMWAWQPEQQKFKLSFPTGFWDTWQKAMLSNHRFLIVLLSLVSQEQGYHANGLIYDKTNNELERFDGLGPNTALAYGLDECDALLRKEFESRIGTHVPKGFKYFVPLDYCPRKVPVFQSKELDQIGFDDLRGNCAVWRLWYIDTRLANPHLKRQQVVKYAMKKLEEYGNFPRFIKSYQAYILANMPKIDSPPK